MRFVGFLKTGLGLLQGLGGKPTYQFGKRGILPTFGNDQGNPFLSKEPEPLASSVQESVSSVSQVPSRGALASSSFAERLTPFPNEPESQLSLETVEVVCNDLEDVDLDRLAQRAQEARRAKPKGRRPYGLNPFAESKQLEFLAEETH